MSEWDFDNPIVSLARAGHHSHAAPSRLADAGRAAIAGAIRAARGLVVGSSRLSAIPDATPA